MASPLDSSSGMWTFLGQASSVVQLVGVDALGLVSMVVQAALAARRHRDACRRLAQHVEIVGGLLRELELADLMRRDATRRPLEQLSGALRRCYKLVTACQDCGYLRTLLAGARMAEELRAAELQIDMFIRLVPLIALVDNTQDRSVKATERVPSVAASCSSTHTRTQTRVVEFTEISVQEDIVPCKVGEQLLEEKVQLQEQKIMDVEELVKLCTCTQESYPGFKKYEFFQMVNGTENFSEKRIVGSGGFGTVYKGELSDGTTVAVKRFDERATDFNNKTKAALLNWSKRLGIIKGLAEGLVYMHKHSRLWMVHGDLKPNNVLLNRDMSPKIGDFGSCRTLSSEVAEEQTSRVVGTRGYIAPEYASRGLYSLKTDVFSFGVLVLVIISGRKNAMLQKHGDNVGNLVRDAWRMWNDGRLHELIDPILGDKYELDEVVRCAHVALLCAQEDPTDRPTMSDVAALLNFESISLLPSPKQPSKLSDGGGNGDKFSAHFGQSSRTIDITITSTAPVSTKVRVILESRT